VEICQGGAWKRSPCPPSEACQAGQCQPTGACRQGETRACYNGPAGTVGKGACKRGSQTCSANGAWGTCQGAVTPKAETCDGKDSDCDGQIDEGINPPCCPQGLFCQRAAGVFFTPSKAEPSKPFLLTLPAGTYSRILLTFEVKHNGWNNEPNGKRFTTFWLEHNDKFLDLYGYLIFNKPNTLILRHGFGLKPTQKPKITKRATIAAGLVYAIKYDFDAKKKTIVAEVRTPSGILATLNSKPTISSIVFKANQNLALAFSNGGHDPNEPPSYGWDYQNARLVLYP